MTIVPIPGADGVFIIRLNIRDGESTDVQIFDQNNQLIYEDKRVGPETKIDLSSQPEGVYKVKVWWGEKLFIEERVHSEK